MAKERHRAWRFTGERSAEGRPLRFFTGIPARDLSERDIVRLDDEQYATVEASDLYEAITAAGEAPADAPGEAPAAEVTPAKRSRKE